MNSENKYLWTANAESAPDYDSILIFKTSKSHNMIMECKDKTQISKRDFQNGIVHNIWINIQFTMNFKSDSKSTCII